jgi:hypothetical protein
MPIFNCEIFDKWLVRWKKYYHLEPTIKQSFRAGYLMGRAEKRSEKKEIIRVPGDLERDIGIHARTGS